MKEPSSIYLEAYFVMSSPSELGPIENQHVPSVLGRRCRKRKPRLVIPTPARRNLDFANQVSVTV